MGGPPGTLRYTCGSRRGLGRARHHAGRLPSANSHVRTMYAIIETGGKQYRVELGSELEVERLPSEAGQQIVLDRVLLVADTDFAAVGRPLVEGAEVHADVVRQDRGEKIVVFKYKAKTRHRSKRGHRQELTVLRIADIVHDGRSAAKAAAAEAKETEAERKAAQREAAAQATRDQALVAELAKKTTAAKAEADAEAKSARGRRKATTAAKPESKGAEKAESKGRPESKRKAESTAKSKPADKAAADRKPTAKAAGTKRAAGSKATTAKASADKSAGKAENTKGRGGRAKKED